MKVRSGFVSNSSSSSFTIKLTDITAKQLYYIINHSGKARSMGMWNCDEAWMIEVDDPKEGACDREPEVRGWTSMDNFDMDEFLRKIGVDPNVVTWGDGYF